MFKENIHSVVDSPKFDPWTVESFFTPKGELVSHDLHMTTIRLKRGTLGPFIEHFRQVTEGNQPYFLEFFSPAGLKMQAEIRNFRLPEEQPKEYDALDVLVYLTPEQVLAFSPDDGGADFGY